MSESNQNFVFSWPLLKVVLEGRSILDVPRLEINTMEEATGLIRAYGFDPASAEDSELLWSFFDESIAFIKSTLQDPEFGEVPEHLASRKLVSDLRRLVLVASEKSRGVDQVFACAILRVMHALIHLSLDPRTRYLPRVQAQVLGRLDAHLFTDTKSGATYLGSRENGGVKLLFIKKKERKDREREAIKLLHKADSVVEEIYDRIGYRLVTETRFDAIRAVRYLMENNVISVPNIRPGRSRNRLFDLKRLEFEVDRIATHIAKNHGTAPYIDKLIRRLERRIGTRRLGRSLVNPHTSEHYKALQFTCREILKVENPVHRAYLNMRSKIDNLHGGSQALHEAFPVIPPAFEYLIYPFEVQIMDVKSYADSIFGKSSHEEYRKKQLELARNRVFGRAVPI